MHARIGLWIGWFGVLLLVFFASRDADAGGVGLLESGAKRMGSAYAGGAAAADDATTIWWNPAGMTRLRRRSFALAAHYISPRFQFSDAGSADVTSMPLTGGNADGGEDGFVPSAYAAFRVGRRWSVGLSINTPFGLSTKYPDDWVGRYYATDSELLTINIHPAAAFRVNRRLSIGAGVSAMYADATLKNQVDFGALGGAPQTSDGTAKVKGDDWGFGFDVGLLYECNCNTRFGLHYQSRIKHTLEGEGTFSVPTAVAGMLPAGLFTDTGARADIEFPDSLSLSAYHRINPCFAVMGDVTWTGWSSFDALVVKFDNPIQPDSVLDLDWDDTLRFAAGVAYTPNRRWEFRAGALFDQGPVPTRTRGPKIPDADRFWVTAGLGYRINSRLRLDVSYAHIFGNDTHSNLTSPRAGTFTGAWDARADLIGFQLSLDF